MSGLVQRPGLGRRRQQRPGVWLVAIVIGGAVSCSTPDAPASNGEPGELYESCYTDEDCRDDAYTYTDLPDGPQSFARFCDRPDPEHPGMCTWTCLLSREPADGVEVGRCVEDTLCGDGCCRVEHTNYTFGLCVPEDPGSRLYAPCTSDHECMGNFFELPGLPPQQSSCMTSPYGPSSFCSRPCLKNESGLAPGQCREARSYCEFGCCFISFVEGRAGYGHCLPYFP